MFILMNDISIRNLFFVSNNEPKIDLIDRKSMINLMPVSGIPTNSENIFQDIDCKILELVKDSGYECFAKLLIFNQRLETTDC